MSTLKDALFPIYPTGARSRDLDSRLADGAVNVAEEAGYTGDGVTPDDDAWDAAIQRAYSTQKGIVWPGKTFWERQHFFGNPADHTYIHFSMALMGNAPGLGNQNNAGSQIITDFNDDVAVLFGPGQSLYAGGFTVIGPDNGWRAAQDPDGVGIGFSGGSGGTNKFLCENVATKNFSTGIQVGADSDGLGDSGTIKKVFIENSKVGIAWVRSQNYIQSVYDSQISAKQALSSIGHNVLVSGGNYSAVFGQTALCNVTAVSALTATTVGNTRYYEFTADFTSPPAHLISGVLDVGAIWLPSFGRVPLEVVSYNAGTTVATLRIRKIWGYHYYQQVNAKTASTIDTELQAITQIMLAEEICPFNGGAFTASNIHIENVFGVAMFFRGTTGWDGSTTHSYFRNIYFNADPSNPLDLTGSDNVSKQIMQAHPFIELLNQNITIEGMRTNHVNPLNFDLIAGGGGVRWDVKDLIGGSVNQRVYSGSFGFDGELTGASPGTGAGMWEPTPFVPETTTYTPASDARRIGWNKSPFGGLFPAKSCTPRLTPAQYTVVSGSLPAFGTGNDPASVTYPLICGGTNYSVGSEVATNAGAPQLVRSNHKFLSYGQNLTTTNIDNLAWSFIGGTPILFLNVEAFERIFPGLGLFLSHASIGGGTPFECVCTGTNKEEGYAYVMPISGTIFPGTAGTEYTGTAIGQAAYSFTTT